MKLRIRKTLSLLLAICMVVTMLPTFAIEAAAADPPTDYWSDAGNYTPVGVTNNLHISSAEELAGFMVNVNNGNTYAGYKVYLDADIDLSEHLWKPIGDNNKSSAYFSGSFYGQDHTISGMIVSGAYAYAGLFGYVYSVSATATYIKDINVSGSVTTTTAATDLHAGGLIGKVVPSSSDIYVYYCNADVSVTANVLGTTQSYLGGLVGFSCGTSSTNSIRTRYCSAAGDVTLNSTATVNNSFMGGLIGKSEGNGSLKDEIYYCDASGDVLFSPTSLLTQAYLGGLVGESRYTTCFASSATGSATDNLTTSHTRFMGGFYGNDRYCTTNNSYCTGSVVDKGTTGQYPGGFAGVTSYSTFTNCFTTSGISSACSDSGGFVGATSYDTFTDCYWRANGSLITRSDYIGLSSSATVNSMTMLSDAQMQSIGTIGGSGTTVGTSSFSAYTLVEALNRGETSGVYRTFFAGESNPVYGDYWTDPGNYDRTIAGQAAQDLTITTAEQLAGFAVAVNNYSKDYAGCTVKLGANIDLSGYYWFPIGDTTFNGTFDGQGYSITNMDCPAMMRNNYYQGLFGTAGSAAIIKNLSVTGTIDAYSNYATYVGGLVGRNLGTVSGCSADVDITYTVIYSREAYIGGLIGNGGTAKNSYATGDIEVIGAVSSSLANAYYAGGFSGGSTACNACFATGDVTASGYSTTLGCGGFTGYVDDAIINCYSTGAVTTSGNASIFLRIGGFAGTSSSGSISNCYSTGAVTDSCQNTSSYYGTAGGFIGSGSVPIKNCYTASALTVTGTTAYKYRGGFVGTLANNITDGYWLQNGSYTVYGVANGTGSIGNRASGFAYSVTMLTENQLKNLEAIGTGVTYYNSGSGSSYTGMMIVAALNAAVSGITGASAWTNDAMGVVNSGYPTLGSSNWTDEGNYDSGIATAYGANITITSAAQLAGLCVAVNNGVATYENYTVKLGNDINLSGYVWTPIGNATNQFKGTFDGQGHTVSNMGVVSAGAYNGLFGYTGGATVKNLGVTGSVKTYCGIASYTGGLIGYATATTVSNCTVSVATTVTDISSATAYNNTVGGMIGYATGSAISDSSASGVITVAGQSNYTYKIGGFIGEAAGAAATVTACYAAGSIAVSGSSATQYLGGFSGYIDIASILNCYSTTPISDTAAASTSIYMGGFTGYTGAAISNCYSTGAISSTGTATTSAFFGGFAAFIPSSKSIAITNCYTANTLTHSGTATFSAGGFGGSFASSSASVTDCYWLQNGSFSIYTVQNGSGCIGVNSAAISSLTMLTEAKLQNSAVIGSGATLGTSSYTESTIVTALDTAANSITGAQGWACASGVNNGYPCYGLSVIYNGNNANGGSVPVDSNSYMTGNKATVLGNTGSLVKTGYVFMGWNTAANGTGLTYAAGDAVTMGASRIVLYAKWIEGYTVTYDINYTGSTPIIAAVQSGYKLTAPTDPTRSGYSFGGWYREPACSNAWVFDTDTISGDVTLYAKWTLTPLSFVTTTLDSGTYAASYNCVFNEATQGTGNYTYAVTSGALPAGLSLQSATHSISGAPTEVGTFDFIITVTDTGTELTSATSFTLTIASLGTMAVPTADVASGTSVDAGEMITLTAATGATIYYTTDGSTPTSASTAYTAPITISAATTVKAVAARAGYLNSSVVSFAYSVKTYALNYDGNTYTGGAVPAFASLAKNGTVTVSGNTGSLVKTGYTFAGWNTAANGSGNAYAAGSTFTMLTAGATLYAQWSPVSHNLAYNGNGSTGGAVPTAMAAYAYDATVTVLGNTGSFVKTGFTFTGWNTAADGTGTAYSATNSFSMPAGDVTLYAIWDATNYSVSYDGNGKTGGDVPSTTYYDYGTTATASANSGSLVRTGYSFNGWNTLANGTGTPYSESATFTMGAANVILYAQWTVNPYTVVYSDNGSTSGSVPTASANYNYGATVTVFDNTNTLAKTGYTFTGWNTAANGTGTTYSASNTFSMPATDLTLYALWDADSHSVSYDGNGNTGGTVPSTAYYDYGTTAAASTNSGSLVRTGYSFNGWNTAANGSGTGYAVSDTFAMGLTNVTLYAQWVVDQYTVTYAENNSTSGSVPTTAANCNYGSTVTVLSNTGTLARTGYTFIGWNTAANGLGTTYSAGNTFSMPASNVTLYALWSTSGFTVSYDGNTFSSGTAPTTSTYGYGTTVTVSAAGTLEKTGYTFDGWSTTSSGAVVYAAGNTFVMGDANVTLYAVWKINQYPVTYNDNSATSGSVPVSATNYDYGETVTVAGNTNTLARTGYTFIGWNTAANGTGTTYSASNTFSMPGKAVTLYALWDADSYSVSYDGNGYSGGSVPSTAYYDYDSTATVKAAGTLVKTGYTFDGWNTAANGSGTGYAVSDTFKMSNANVILYAQWDIGQYTVTYSGNSSTGGSVPTAAANYDYEETVTVLGNANSLVRTGYAFSGWNTKADGSGTTYSAGDAFSMPAGAVTLYAKWTPTWCAVSYDGNGNDDGSVPATAYYDFDATVTASNNTGTLVKTGYSFDGWNTMPDGLGEAYSTGSTFSMGTTNVTLYAQWKIKSYTVSYDGNGSTDGSEPTGDSYAYNDTVTVESNSDGLVRTGYTFNGWNTKADGTGISYAADNTFSMPAHSVTLYAFWAVDGYTVSYDGNTNTGGSAPATVCYDYDDTVTVSGTGTLVKTGYTFDGWSTTSDGSVEYTEDNTFTMGDENVTLFAQWTINSYTVSYDTNGSTDGTAPSDDSYTFGDMVTVAEPGALEKTGYTFTGWNTEADGTGTAYSASNTFSMPAKNVTLYTAWDAISYSVSYDGNGNTAGAVPASQNFDYDDAAKVSGNTGALVRTGYTFDGWNTAMDGSGTDYASGDTFRMETSNVTLYAVWNINSYTLAYDGNGSTGGTAPTGGGATYGSTVTVSDNSGSLAKTGYTFLGWNTAANGSGVAYKASDTFSMPAANVTLYAQWDSLNYTLSYDGNGYTGGSVPASTSYKYGVTATVSANTNDLVKTGYTFDGWSTTASGTAVYSGTGAETLTMGSANITLYAVWSLNSYTLSYNSNGSTAGSAPTGGAYDYGAEVTVGDQGTLVKTGYTFKGWNTASDGSGTDYSNSNTFCMPASNVTLYAVWDTLSYSISYDGNGFTGGSVPSTSYVKYDDTATVSANTGNLVKTGYTFNGWNTQADGSGTGHSAGGTFTMGAANVTLYAVWTVNTYSLDYNENGSTSGTAPGGPNYNYAASVTVSDNTGTLAKTGYNFAGWNTASDGSGTAYAKDDVFSMPAHNVTLYAMWTVTSYSVSYDGNGNTDGTIPASTTYDFGTTATVSSNTGSLVKTGYTFDGWNTKADGTGSNYSMGSTFGMPSANVTLFAKWKIKTLALTYNSNGSTGGSAPSGGSYNYGNTVTVSGNTGPLVKTGYMFLGWNTASDGTGTTYSADNSFSMPDVAVTLYAMWDSFSYTVSYDGNGYTDGEVPASAGYKYGLSVTVSGNTGSLVKTGYSFNGWNTKADGTGTVYAADASFSMAAANVTLFAQWTINSYTLVYHTNGSTSGTAPTGGSNTYGSTVTVSDNTDLAKTGYTFTGWNTASNGSGTSYSAGNTFTMPADAVTLYAVWECLSYSVSYDVNGATGGSVPASDSYKYGVSVTVSGNTGSLAKAGCMFGGWSTSPTGAQVYTGSGSETFTMGASNVTLYAVWTIGSYTLTYYGNGSTGGTVPTGGNINYGTTVTVSNNTGSLVKTGYTFTGWNTALDGSGTTYSAGNTFSMPASAIDLYAKWDSLSYTVSYDGNGYTGGNVPASAAYKYGVPVTVSDNTGSLVKSGNVFNGWNTKADGSGTAYTAGASFLMGTTNVTLYAVWATDSYTVTYNSNGATDGSVPGTASYCYGNAVTVSANTGSLAKTGYAFAGWNTASDYSGTSYAAGSVFNMPNDNVTLYARWGASSYTLTYNGNGATSNSSAIPAAGAYSYNQVITLAGVGSLTKTDHTFAGWNTAADGTGTTYSAGGAFSMPAANTTLYAKWVSAEATLFGLTASAGSFNETFSPSTTAYTMTLSDSVLSTTVTPTLASGAATVAYSLNNSTWTATTSGSPTGSISLAVGIETVYLKVTAPDEATTITYTITITVKPEAPTITEQPVDISENVGDTGTLSVTATGTGTLTYTWYVSSVDANTGGSSVATGTGTTYTPPSTSSGTLFYYCVVTNTVNSATATTASDTATVTVTGGSTGTGGGGGGGGDTVYVYVSGTGSSAADYISAGVTSEGEVYPTSAEKVTVEVNGIKVTTVDLTSSTVQQELLDFAMKNQDSTIMVNVSDEPDFSAQLTAQTIKDLGENDIKINLASSTISYVVPAKAIDLDELIGNLGSGAALSQVNIDIAVSEVSESEIATIESILAAKGYELVLEPIDFKITAEYSGSVYNVERLDKFSARYIQVGSDVDLTRLSTAVVVDPDGTITHVPTRLTQIDGVQYIEVSSMRNSTYAVIYNTCAYKDVTDHWAEELINKMGTRTAVKGIGDNEFDPDRSVTRAEFAAFIVNALGLKPFEYDGTFSDVDSNAWYCAAIETAYQYDIVEGNGDGTFSPNDEITRAEAIAMICRTMAYTKLYAVVTVDEAKDILSEFTDNSEIASYFIVDVATCVKVGLILGRDNSIAPNEDITRAEAIAIIYRLLENSELI